jgi:tol-pal system protein YbgF
MAPYLALGVVLLAGAWAGEVPAGSRAEREEAARRRKAQVERARETARANRLAEVLIREELARRRGRQEAERAAADATAAAGPGRRVAVSGGRPLPAQTAPAADAGLDRVFGRNGAWTAEPAGASDYPTAIVVPPRPATRPPAAASRIPAAETVIGPEAPPEAGRQAAVLPAPVPAGSDGLDLFHTGYSRFSQGDYGRAREAFAEFLTRYPGHELADSAQYWIGECAYAQGDYTTALVEYRKVIESFPFGDKVADALLKSGYALLELGRTAEARELLGQLVEEYPESGAAKRARERLAGTGAPPAM